MVAAAVVFRRGCSLPAGLADSKVLSAAERARLAAAIRQEALAFGLGAASVREIERLNIRVATALAMRRALRHCRAALEGRLPMRLPLHVLLDGLPMRELESPHRALVDGDAHCVSIAAASILAKTVRDALMERLDRRWPAYGWQRNAGYGTKAHRAALHAHGPSPHHRRTFGTVAQLALE